MDKPLHFTKWIPDDLAKATFWYDSISLRLGNRFRKAINAGFDAVERKPEIYPFAYGDLGLRFYRVKGFPYLILYRIGERAIVVFAVRHSASDLKTVRSRAVDDPS